MTPEVVLVAAMDRNGVIGKDNALPWRLGDDLKAFKTLTRGSTVVMGRKTRQSIGRPLPDRRNLVLTRDPTFTPAGAETVSSPEAALEQSRNSERIFIIGGEGVYAAFLPRADRLVLTRVDACIPDGDAFFPPWNPAEYRLTASRPFAADDRNEFSFVIEEYVPTRSHR